MRFGGCCWFVLMILVVVGGCRVPSASPPDPAPVLSQSVQRFPSSCLSPCLVPIQQPDHALCVVITQGYGIGTHTPPEVFGAIDLAVGSPMDGTSDPSATWNVAVRAAHDGMVIRVAYQPSLAGNHVRVANERFLTAYSHLATVTVQEGQWVRVGDVIGTVGSTGASTGPHLDYQVWVWSDQMHDWVNQDPLIFHPTQTFCPSRSAGSEPAS